MLSFECDYTEGAHERILQKLIETNMEQHSGYGSDIYCESAKEKIRKACQCPQAQVFFLTGGTQTNQIVIDSMLKPYEGVAAAQTGHVNVHEAGAIEFTGHKVMELLQHEGKIYAKELEEFLQGFWRDENYEHMVFPGMVYISYPTEYGTLYSEQELRELSSVCKKYSIPLYMDGARLGYGLMSNDTDVTLPMIAKYCDVFYIGGTKVGALCGEAVVFTKNNMPAHFLTIVKQHGALLAKGRLLGIQFDTLFTDNLYFKVSRHAIEMAERLKKGFREKGYSFLLDSPTNQQFIILENKEMEALKEKVRFSYWEKADETHTAVRFATSWATREQDIDELMEILDEMHISDVG
ncbi:MAG: low specificity L-threonine aldolase [Eubacteriales bacterium]|nr:low specificity L-threonine aldolase [Eubacteriales bacterium]